MNRVLCLCVLSLLCGTLTAGQLPSGVTLIPDAAGYTLRLTLPAAATATRTESGEVFDLLSIPGWGRTADVGRPQLPTASFHLFLGATGSPEVTVTSTTMSRRTLERQLYPAQEPWPRSLPLAERPFRMDRAWYATRGEASSPLVQVSEPFVIAGERGVTVTLSPFSVDPSAGVLRTVVDAEVRIAVRPAAAASPHSEQMRSYLAAAFANFPAAGLTVRSPYLIITAPDLESHLAPFTAHKQMLGYTVTVVTTAVTGTTNTAIKAYIQTLYDNPATRPEFVLLVGDVDRIPEWIGSTTNTPHTDLMYTLLDGTDAFADLHIGRFPVSSAQELQNMIAKSIAMENSIFSLTKTNTFMSSNDNWSITEGTHNAVIDTFFTPNGYANLKRYSHTYSATTSQVIGDLNAGQIFAIYSGHGSVTSWADGPPVSQSDVRGLTNSVYPFVYSFACLTGEFQSAECFGETWVRIPRGGTTFWGSSVTSYWDEDDILEKRLFHSMFTDRLTQSTPMFNMAKVYLAQHYGGVTPTVRRYIEMYNLFGDPSIHTASFTANFGWVSGAVTSGGAPLADVQVDFTDPVAQQGGFSDPAGLYLAGARVDTGASTALMTLRAQKFGYITLTDTITVVREDTVLRDLTLAAAPGGALHLTALDGTSAAMGADVTILYGGVPVVTGVTHPATGIFTAPLPEGSYALRVDAPSPFGTVRIDSFFVGAPDTTRLVVILRHVVELSPAALIDTLVVGQSRSQVLTLTNTTPDSVPFRLSDDVAARLRFASRGPAVQPRALPIPAVERPKGSAEPAGLPLSPDGRGGPDVFGYRWVDSDEPDGPAFAWTDISTVGTAITGLGDDTNVGPFPIGFPFPFYGNSYTAVRFCTNGWMSFTSTSTAYSNNTLPSAAEPNNAVYAFWDDLSFSSTGDAYTYYDAAAMQFIVQWTAVPRISGTAPYTFQIVLRPSGEILFYYLDMTGALDGATAGIENADGSVALQLMHNAGYIHDSLAVRFFLPDAPWISENPPAGLLPPFGAESVTVTFDALGLDPGSTHRATITLDAAHPDLAGAFSIPATLQVEPADSALLILDRASLQFPVTGLGAVRRDSLTARNGGALALTLSSLTSTAAEFTVTPAAATLQPGDSVAIVVSYAPLAAGVDTGRVILLSNSQGAARTDILLEGTAVGMPGMTVWPDSLSFVMNSGADTTRQMLKLRNPGTDTLHFTLREALRGTTASVLRSREQQPQPPAVKEGPSPTGPVSGKGRGGPDAGGYVWIDSDEPGGPVFQWQDIRSTGTQITTWTGSADDGHALVTLPFGFPYYGLCYSSMKICTNGWMGFEVSSTTNAYSNGPIPAAATEPNSALYPWWDDLNVASGGTVHYLDDAPNGRFIVQYTNVPHYGTTTPGLYTFQVILTPSGAILFQYLDMQQTLNSSTIGIESPDGTIGLQVAYNTAWVHDDLALLFTQDMIPWMSTASDHGTLAPGDSLELEVVVHPGVMAAGSRDAALLITGNCPDTMLVPVHLEVLTDVAEEADGVPLEFGLGQVYPNPFNPGAKCELRIAAWGVVRAVVYDLLGREVAVLQDGVMEPGVHTVRIDGASLASGVYFLRMTAAPVDGSAGFTGLRKLVLLK